MQSPSRIWTRWRRMRPGSCAVVWCRWSHSVTARGSRAAVRSRVRPGRRSRQVRPRPAGRCRHPVSAAGTGRAGLGAGWRNGFPGWAAVSAPWPGAAAGWRPAGVFGAAGCAGPGGFGAAVGGGVPVLVGDRDTPGGGGVAGGVGGQGAGEVGVDGAERGGFPGVAGEAEQGGQRDGQVDRRRRRRPGLPGALPGPAGPWGRAAGPVAAPGRRGCPGPPFRSPLAIRRAAVSAARAG